MTEQIAILDLGTNTFNLLIAEKSAGGIKMIHQSKEISRLGEGGIDKNEILPHAFERGINALKKHRLTIDSFSCSSVFAYATSAVRDALNGKEFVQKAEAETGIKIDVVNGEKEAELIWEGARNALKINEPSLIMDIGGGSVELIIGDADKMYWKKSYRIGVSRLKECFIFSDPATISETEALKKFLEKDVEEISESCKIYNVNNLIGCSGSFDSFADMVYSKKTGTRFNSLHLSAYAFETGEIKLLLNEIISTSAAERQQVQGLSPMRRDFIVYGAVLTQMVMEKCHIKNVFLSAYSLKEGVFFSRLTKK